MRFALFFAALLLVPAHLLGCTCSGPDPICSAYWQSKAIFRGRVLEQTLISHTETSVKNLDGTTSTVVSPGYYRVRFSVLEMLKGEPQQQKFVLTHEQESACGFPFAEGGEYVVFSSSDEATGELWTSKCTDTHALEAGKEDADLLWMRALATAPDGATIYGRFLLPPGLARLSGPASLAFRGPEIRGVIPDESGRYALNRLLPGEYTVSAAVPPGFTSSGVRTVAVVNKGCAQVD